MARTRRRFSQTASLARWQLSIQDADATWIDDKAPPYDQRQFEDFRGESDPGVGEPRVRDMHWLAPLREQTN
jgi:hypothetical protein